MVCLEGEALSQWRTSQLNRLATEQSVVLQAHDRKSLMGELDWLLREVTGLDRLALRLGLFQSCPSLDSSKSLGEIDHLWQQRVELGIPLQYLLGYTVWRNFVLEVSPAVLIPRPETEGLIDLVTQVLQSHPNLSAGDWLDLGTGSGAIAFGLTEVLPNAAIHAVDKSAEALGIAQRNAQKLGLSDRIQFWQGSWFEPLPHPAGSVSGICSNPPYIPTDTIQTLQPEVLNHEPHLALDGGATGLDAIRHLVQQAQFYLCSGGLLLMECMAGQGEAIATLMEAQHYHTIQIHPDLAGHDRFVQGFKP
jgi:release factor glutamine methyltransferase